MNWTPEQFEEHMRRIAPRPVTIVADDTITETRCEAEIEAECTKLLEEDGWRALRTDPVSDRSKGKGFGELGMADHLYMRYAYSADACSAGVGTPGKWEIHARILHSQVMWIEFKAPKGKPSKKQRLWHQKERARGALTLIAGEDFPATVEGFKQWYRVSGLNRGRV